MSENIKLGLRGCLVKSDSDILGTGFLQPVALYLQDVGLIRGNHIFLIILAAPG